ncbi:MAG: septation ring formation regulator EzrA [Bacilli bacterium]
MKIFYMIRLLETQVNVPVIVTCIVCGVVAITCLSVLFYIFFYRPNKKKRLIKEVERKYQYYHALLNAQCLQIISRLEIISHSNLLYSSYHSQFLKRYRDISDKKDKEIEDVIYDLNDFLTNKKKKNFKIEYQKVVANLSEYIALINDLNDSLMKIIKPEEECRTKALQIKDHMIQVRKKYYQKNNDFQIAIPTFDKLFNKIDKKFNQFEAFIDSARYDEAREIISPIDEVIDLINDVIDKLPQLAIAAESELPEKLSSLILKYEFYEGQDIPLFHICTKDLFENYKIKIEEIRNEVRLLKTEQAKKDIEYLRTCFVEIENKINNEFNAKEEFEKRFSGVYKKAHNIEDTLVKLYNDIPTIRNNYVLDGRHKNYDIDLNTEADKLALAKRKVESSIHCANKQPFSQILEKLNELEAETCTLNNMIDSFNSYALTLKSDCLNAYKLVFASFQDLKKNEVLFNSMKFADSDKEKMTSYFARSFELLNSIYVSLKTKPIDVIAIDKMVLEFNNKYDLTTRTVKDTADLIDKCNSLFKSSNKIRDGIKSIDEEVIRAETLYLAANYDEAYKILLSLVDKHSGIESETPETV